MTDGKYDIPTDEEDEAQKLRKEKEELEKLKAVIKQLTGDTKPDEKTSPPKIPLSPNDIKALLQLADDPNKDKIIAFLKAKTGNGVSTTKTIVNQYA